MHGWGGVLAEKRARRSPKRCLRCRTGDPDIAAEAGGGFFPAVLADAGCRQVLVNRVRIVLAALRVRGRGAVGGSGEGAVVVPIVVADDVKPGCRIGHNGVQAPQSVSEEHGRHGFF